jgi:hypothetical protein
MGYDISTAAIERIPELRDQLIDIAKRRTAVTTMVEETKVVVQRARAQRTALANAMAGGIAPDLAAMSANAKVVSDSEAHLAVAMESLQRLDEEEGQATELLNASERLEGQAKKKALIEDAQKASRELDDFSALWNAKWESWKAAREKAHFFMIPHASHGDSTAPWPGAEPGFLGAAALHPTVLMALARSNSPPNMKSVANPQRGF